MTGTARPARPRPARLVALLLASVLVVALAQASAAAPTARAATSGGTEPKRVPVTANTTRRGTRIIVAGSAPTGTRMIVRFKRRGFTTRVRRVTARRNRYRVVFRGVPYFIRFVVQVRARLRPAEPAQPAPEPAPVPAS